MNETLLNYIVQGILGAASGYITNDYAINMLFKEYTPLKLGGVIKKTRNEFVENLSSMIENDIINKEKLDEILESDESRENFKKLTKDFFEQYLYEVAGSDKFSDIEGFDSTVKDRNKFVKDILNKHMEDILNLIISNLNISDFLTESQLDKIVDSLYMSLVDFCENTHTVEDILTDLYEKNKELQLAELIDRQIITRMVSKFAEVSWEDTSLYDLIESTGLEDAVRESLSLLYDRQLKDFLVIDDERLKTLIISYINSDRGRQRIYEFCEILFSYGKTLNINLLSLLDSSFESKLKKYIAEILPLATVKIIALIENKGLVIDQFVEESIDEVIKKSEGLRAKLISTLRNTYFNNLSKKYSILDRIISFIEKTSESEILVENISSKIIEELNNITISQIIIQGESNNFNSRQAADMLISHINNNESMIQAISYLSQLYLKDIFPKVNFSVEKIFASEKFPNLFTNKSTDYIVDALCQRTLSQYLDQTSVEDISSFIRKAIKDNEESIKNWTAGKIRDVDFKKNIFNIPEIADFIKEEAYKKYKTQSSKLNNVELSLAFDKLNSLKNLPKKSWQHLQSYMINNRDIVLKGSIKGIVSDNLNKLSDDEIVDFANDFIGRELKPIMFFGGVLGMIAGLILAAFQNSPLQPGETNIANMITYAFVGFITNVIAINLIFKPYRENKFLAKIPFFRNFALGYIVKNQKNFAENTALYIDETLLSKNSINQLFDKHKTDIKNSFIKNIRKNSSDKTSNFFRENKINIVSKVCSFIKDKIFNNLSGLSKYLKEKISDTKVTSVINENNRDRLRESIQGKLTDKNSLSNAIYSQITSDNPLKARFPDEILSSGLEDYTLKYHEKSLDIFANENYKNFLLKYTDEYENFKKQNINEVFNVSDENIYALSKNIKEIILSQDFINNFSHQITDKFNESVAGHKTFGELFGGKIKLYIDNNLPRALDKIYPEIKAILAENKSKLSLAIRSEIKNNLDFIERNMYSIMGGDEIIDDLMTNILTDKIPKFTDLNKGGINNIAVELIEENFYKTKVEVLYTGLNKLQIDQIVNGFFAIQSHEKIERKINELIVELNEKISNKNIGSILNSLGIGSLEELLNLYQREIEVFAAVIYSNLKDRSQIQEKASAFINSTVDSFMDIKFKEVFDGLSYEDVEKIISDTVDALSENPSLQDMLKNILDAYIDFNRDLSIDYFIDSDLFVESVKEFIEELLANKSLDEQLKDIIWSIISEAVDSDFSFIHPKSKEYLLNIFVHAGIESLKNNLDNILKSVEFNEIAREEIEKMGPEKIHEMFNSFGGKYFTKLMLYGFGGFVFGINMSIGFTLTGLKIISEVLKKDR